MFSRKDKTNNTLAVNEHVNDEVKPRRSARLSMLANANYNENRTTGHFKIEKVSSNVIGAAGRHTKPLIDEKSSASVSSTLSDRLSNAFATKPICFNDLRFGGGSTMVSVEFADDIDKYLRHLEKTRNVQPDFLRGKKVDGRMRQILVDWLMQVQSRFQLCSETLQLAIAILDQALTRMDVSKDKLQLLGVSSLFIASKFEEIYVPNIQDFVYISANIFVKKDVLRMEQQILHALDYQLGFPYTIQFLRKYRSLMNADNATHNLAKFIAEVALLDYNLAHTRPSKIAGTAVYIASRIRQIDLPAGMFDVMEMTEAELISLSKKFAPAIQQWIGPDTKLQSLKTKFDKLHTSGISNFMKSLDMFIELETVPEETEV